MPNLLISRAFSHSWKIAHLFMAFGMTKIIIDKDDSIVYRIFICSVRSVPQMSQLSGRDASKSIANIIFYF